MIEQIAEQQAAGAFAVRPAVPADLKSIGQLQEAAILGLGISDYDSASAAAWVRFQLSTRNNVLKDGPFFVAERHGRIIACGGWRTDLQRRDAVWVRAVFVSPEFARQGACSRVMDAVEVSARIEGRDHFFARATVGAIPFFKAVGYRDLGRRIWTIEPGIEIEQALMMKDATATEGS